MDKNAKKMYENLKEELAALKDELEPLEESRRVVEDRCYELRSKKSDVESLIIALECKYPELAPEELPF